MPDREAVTILSLSRLAAKHGYQVKIDQVGCHLIDLLHRFPQTQAEREDRVFTLHEAWDFFAAQPLLPRLRVNRPVTSSS